MSPSYEPSLPRLLFPRIAGRAASSCGHLTQQDPPGRPVLSLASQIRVCLGYGTPPGSIRDTVPQALLLGQRPGSLQRETDSAEEGEGEWSSKQGAAWITHDIKPRDSTPQRATVLSGVGAAPPPGLVVRIQDKTRTHSWCQRTGPACHTPSSGQGPRERRGGPPLGQQESRGGGRGAHLSGGTDVTCSARHMLGVSERVS
ncbi:unnamed protein product [Gadus morhua 'NCC']